MTVEERDTLLDELIEKPDSRALTRLHNLKVKGDLTAGEYQEVLRRFTLARWDAPLGVGRKPPVQKKGKR